MRTRLKYLLLLGITATLLHLALTACKKDDSFYAGSSRLRGTIFFENNSTGTLDTAYRAQFRIYPSDGDTAQALTYTLTSGRFDITNLDDSKTYTLFARLDRRLATNQPYVAYQARRLQVRATGSLDTLRLLLRPDLSRQTGLQVTLTNPAGYLVPQAQVYLFADSIIGQRNRYTGAGSIASARTNTQGKAVFLNLQPKAYYISVFAVLGKDTLRNSPASQIGIKNTVVATSTIANYPIQLSRLAVVVSASAPSLRLTVTDSTGRIVLPGSQVCLYTNANQIKRKGLGCVNGLFSGTTNAQGQVVFAGLQAAPYYFLAVKVLGTDTLTNLRNGTLIGPLPATGEFPSTVKLRR